MALGRVLGGGSSVNAMVWTRGTERDYDTWERHGATGWAFKDVLPTFKAQEDWEGGANDWRGAGGPVADAVVDSKLRVHGLRGLRVADASVMPSIISGPGTNAASYMIGGRAAELIKADA
jgi:choline dehydrogenase-like flavoprotein